MLASIVGGTFIAIGDHLFHVRTHVLTHFWHPRWDGQTLLVFPLFMGAAAFMILAAVGISLAPLLAGQDILGEYQDCVTHRAMLSKDLARQRRLGLSQFRA